MTSTIDEQILKTDRRGRVRVPAERREALLAEFERGGTSAAEFARLTGLKYATFAGWVAQRKRRRAAAAAALPADGGLAAVVPGRAVRLFEAVVVPAPAALACAELRIELPGGARLRVECAAQVPLAVELLGALAAKGGRPC